MYRLRALTYVNANAACSSLHAEGGAKKGSINVLQFLKKGEFLVERSKNWRNSPGGK